MPAALRAEPIAAGTRRSARLALYPIFTGTFGDHPGCPSAAFLGRLEQDLDGALRGAIHLESFSGVTCALCGAIHLESFSGVTCALRQDLSARHIYQHVGVAVPPLCKSTAFV